MKKKYVTLISVLMVFVFMLTGCRKKIIEQRVEQNSSNKIEITTENHMTEDRSEKEVNLEMFLDSPQVMEEWDSVEDNEKQNTVTDTSVGIDEDNGVNIITDTEIDILTDDRIDNNTLKELSEVPFA